MNKHEALIQRELDAALDELFANSVEIAILKLQVEALKAQALRAEDSATFAAWDEYATQRDMFSQVAA